MIYLPGISPKDIIKNEADMNHGIVITVAEQYPHNGLRQRKMGKYIGF